MGNLERPQRCADMPPGAIRECGNKVNDLDDSMTPEKIVARIAGEGGCDRGTVKVGTAHYSMGPA